MSRFAQKVVNGSAPFARIRQRKDAFVREEEGSLTIFTLFIFGVMFVVAGLAVDVMRFETTRIHVQSTLDRAVLAAADLEQTLTPEEVVAGYFDAAGLSELIVETKVQQGLNYKTVEAFTFAEVDSLFIQTLGIDSLRAPGEGAAEEKVSDVEISLVLDVSGSMYGTKIANLKTAAGEFIDTVMPEDGATVTTTDSLVHMSIVPYNNQSNAGSTLGSYLNFSGEHSNSYCANWKSSDFLSATVTPTTPIRQSAHWDYSNYKGTSSRWVPECRTYSYNQIQPFVTDPVQAKSFINSLVASGNTSIDIGAKWGVTLLNDGLQPMVTDMITAGTLSNKFEGRPYAANGGALKVMIIMTDGKNTSQYEVKDSMKSGMSYLWLDPSTKTLSVDLEAFAYSKGLNPWAQGLSASRKWFRQDGAYDTSSPKGGSNAVQLSWPQVWEWGGMSYVFERVMYEVYRESSVPWEIRKDGYYWRTDVYERFTQSTKDPRTSSICKAGRDAGIVVYAIGFETGFAGDAVLSDCASSASHFFKASNANISDVFAAIATQINQLKLIY